MKGELGEEMDSSVCVGGTVAGIEDGMEGDRGTSTIGHGTADDDIPYGGCSSGSRERLAAIRRGSTGKEGTSE